MNEIITGDALTTLRTLPDNLVQCCVTSPPYYGLRDYGIDGQIGLEDTPQEYIAKLVEVFREVKRVLRDDGVLWLNIGDSYAGSGKGSGGKQAYLYDLIPRNDGKVPPGCKPKDLMGIPWMLAFALRADGWYLRQEIIWHKPNVKPESMTDRPTTAHEHIFLLAKSNQYYYNAEAIREQGKEWKGQAGTFARSNGKATLLTMPGQSHVSHRGERDDRVPIGRNKRSVWAVNTLPYSEAHFATMPPKLIEPCILAGSRPGDIVLDPFMGAGTVALVAIQHKRYYLGIELNPEYVTLIERRIAHVQQGLWTEATA